MELNLREIAEISGSGIAFETDLSEERLMNASIVRFIETPHAVGEVRNRSGALSLNASLRAKMLFACDRCGDEYEREKTIEVSLPIVSQGKSEDPEALMLEGDILDVGDALETVFILESESKNLCREECEGICPGCGENLNKSVCKCKKQIDPRFAVLEQLLDIQE